MQNCEIIITYDKTQYANAVARFKDVSDEVYESPLGGTQFYKNYECIAVVHKYFAE